MPELIVRGARTPFHYLENMSAYDFHRAIFLISGKKPPSNKKFKKDSLKIFEHLSDNLKRIKREAKKYKCYGHSAI